MGFRRRTLSAKTYNSTVCTGGGGLGDRGPQTDKHLPPSSFIGIFLRKADI
jgi:hypothetical protein